MIATAAVRDAVAAATDAFAAAGCATPRLDAEVLVAEALGVPRERLHTEPGLAVEPAAARVLADWVRRRVQREPVAYIVGRRGFRRIELAVDARVLIPRPETELLVEVAVELPREAWVHDVGTGSGAIAAALMYERPDLRVTASDASAGAGEVARANGVPAWHVAGLPPAAAGADLVVANLPYVTESEWPALAPEIVRYEPREALVAGEDGLDAIRELVAGAPGGIRLALEHAPGQAEAVRGLLAGAETRRDLAGRERVTTGSVP